MKKVLIVSYEYYPLKRAASYMVRQRARYFSEYGWEPVILTRHWKDDSNDIKEETDLPISIEEDSVIRGKVCRTPYRQYLKNIVDMKNRYSSNSIIFKMINWISRKSL